MPLSLADIAKAEVQLTVDTAVGSLVVRYRPNALTPQMESAMTAQVGTDRATETMLKMFCALVSFMDVVGPLDDGDGFRVLQAGEVMPVTPEYVALLPTRLLASVFAAVQEDLTGGPKSPSNSSGGSFTNG